MKFIYAILLTGVLFACKKTETVDAAPEAPDRIESFRITNVQGAPIEAAVSDKDSTITLYLPSWRQLTILEPEITVPAGSTVSPASGTQIEDVFEAVRTHRKITYTVTAANGSRRVYTLQIRTQQPDIELNELSSAEEVKEFSIDSQDPYSVLTIYVKGSGFLENNDLMRVAPVDGSGKELPPFGLSVTHLGNLYQIIPYLDQSKELAPLRDALPATGLYRLRVYVYGRVKTMQFPVRINKL